MLDIKYKYCSLIILTILLISCQSSVRFSSDVAEKQVKSSKSNNGSKKTGGKENKINKIPTNNKKLENLSVQQKVILDEASKWIGVPYCWGGENNNCVDCSGFVKLVFEKVNIYVPRTAAEQYIFSKKVFFDNREVADLVFFKRNNKISHVGIYIGNDEFIHSASSIGVKVQSLNDDYFKDTFAGYGRVLK